MNLEGHRNPNQPLHLAIREPGSGKPDSTLCGAATTEFHWRQTTMFRDWWKVLCPTCGQALDDMT